MAKIDEDYYWIATFDGSIPNIAQFNEDGKELLFKEVDENKKKLEKFELVSPNEKEKYTVDLVNKKITGHNVSYTVTGSNPALIFFKRNSVRAEVGTGNMLAPRCVFHLGIKTSTQEKKLEIFKGLGQKPKKVEYNDVKSKAKLDLTTKITSELSAIK